MLIKTKFTVVAAIAIAATAATAIVNFTTLMAVTDQATSAQTAGVVMRQHMDGDMMHDAIRADVLKATLGLKLQDEKMIAEAKQDVTEHGERFAENLRKNLALPLPGDIAKLLRGSEKALTSYNDEAMKYVDTALADAKNKSNLTEALLPEFEDSFGVLEEQQGSIGDGVESYSESLKHAQIDRAASAKIYAGVLAAVMLLVVGAIPVFSARSIFNPQAQLIKTMQALAAGRTNLTIPFTDRTDEIGEMANALVIFQQGTIDRQRMEMDMVEEKKAQEAERRKAVLTLAKDFEEQVGELAKGVAAAATELQATAQAMTSLSAQAQHRTGSAARESEDAARNASAVAAATEELSASFSEIHQQTASSLTTIGQAVAQTNAAAGEINQLETAAKKIDDVVNLINEIAEQTNLLALNATIEAARAGDAGKGFAVVASEVKSLAGQTAKATHEVAGQVKNIQEAVARSNAAMSGVLKTIGSVNEIISTVAGAVEAQTAATVEITNRVTDASRNTTEIRLNIENVLSATQETGSAASQVLTAAQELSYNGEQLTGRVDTFLRAVRAG